MRKGEERRGEAVRGKKKGRKEVDHALLCGQSCEDWGRGGVSCRWRPSVGGGAFERATLSFHAPVRTKANEKKKASFLLGGKESTLHSRSVHAYESGRVVTVVR